MTTDKNKCMECYQNSWIELAWFDQNTYYILLQQIDYSSTLYMFYYAVFVDFILFFNWKKTPNKIVLHKILFYLFINHDDGDMYGKQ